MATITDIADAVAEELNGGSFSRPFTAVRLYRPLFDLQDMGTLHVTVVPRALSMAQASRTVVQHDYSIDVAVQQKFSDGDSAELDPLMGLVEEIADFFRGRDLASVPRAMWLSTDNDPAYAPEHMDELRQFTSVLTLTYRVWR